MNQQTPLYIHFIVATTVLAIYFMGTRIPTESPDNTGLPHMRVCMKKTIHDSKNFLKPESEYLIDRNKTRSHNAARFFAKNQAMSLL